MFDSLQSIMSALKEGAVEAGAKAYLNQQIQNFGVISELRIDSRLKTILLEAALKGEASPVSVRVGAYEVTSAGDASYIVLHQFEASREWITAVLNQYVAGRPLRIPSNVAPLL